MLFNNFKRDPAPYVFAMFAFIGGFLEAFTFALHGGVFCNAQTGNLVMLVIDFVQGNISGGLKYLYSILAYIAGIFLSTVVPARFKKVNWPLVVTAAEIVILVGIAFIPQGAENWYTYVTVSFVCSVQYNTFTKLRGVALATTFCTNNIRQTVMHFVKGVSEKDRAEFKKSATYAFVILCFAIGAAVGVLSAGELGNYCIIICSVLLLPVLALFVTDSTLSVKMRRMVAAESQSVTEYDKELPAVSDDGSKVSEKTALTSECISVSDSVASEENTANGTAESSGDVPSEEKSVERR